MESTFWTTLTKLAPLWWIITVIIVFVALKFYYTRFKKLEDKVEHADCKTHQMMLDNNKNTVDKIDRSIDRIEKILIAKNPDMLDQFSVVRSPRQLNDSGAKLFANSGADKILDEHLDDLVNMIAQRNPTTAYDVEQYAYSILMELSFGEWFIPLKNFIYNHSVFEGVNLNIGSIAFVMSLPLRNAYLDRHPEINPDDYPESAKI